MSVSSPALPPAATSEPSLADRVYPPLLKAREIAVLWQRRSRLPALYPEAATRGGPDTPAQGSEDFPTDTVGFALSGGGIRSATFCLGVFQALAEKKLLGGIDFLSTVSGGGYFGGFYGAWLNRGRGPAAQPAGLAQRLFFWKRDLRAAPPLAGHFERVQNELNAPGSFPVFWLRQNGRYLAPDGAGDYLLASAAMLRNWLSLHFVLGVFLILVFSLIALYGVYLPAWPAPPGATHWCGRPGSVVIAWSPWLRVLPAVLALGVVLGALYWMPGLPEKDRNRVTRWLTACLAGALGLLGVALVDTAAASLWANRHPLKAALCQWIWEAGGTGAVLLLLARKAVDWLTRLAARDKPLNLPLNVAATLAAAALGLVWLVALATGAHALLDRYPWALPVLFFLAALGTWHFGFVNLSSQASLYSARLIRTYLGASNPGRPGNQRVTETIPGDAVPYETYAPDETGGPLHLINTTVNETVDGRTQVEQHDRKGFNLSLGPVALTAGAVHHALWIEWKGRPRGGIQPIPNGGFHCLAGSGQQPRAVEQLGLGQWIGISGAAFSTGLGARTSLGLSFLCGFFNVRLGHWWDSQLPAFRSARTGFWSELGDWLRQMPALLFPVQMHLLDEFQGRFHGAARSYWYLTDGGHYENTAAYELLRRRLPFIVVCDNGCDPRRQLEDLANLVRKARIDLNAEIDVLDPADEANGVPPAVRPGLGTRADFEAIDEKTGFSRKSALLAKATYLDPQGRRTGESSLLLLIKPTVTGAEPADVLHYHAAHPDFPQQTTADQFFDEAQWESYRKLGWFVAERLFRDARPGALRAAFHLPPPA